MPKSQPGTREIPGGSDPFDKRFPMWLVDHHNDNDRIVGPCATKSSIWQELQDFRTTVDQQHRERVERMKSWLQEWYGEEYPRTDNIPLWLGGLEGQPFSRSF